MSFAPDATLADAGEFGLIRALTEALPQGRAWPTWGSSG